MRTDSRELLAIGIFGNKSKIGDRIELLLHHDRVFSPRASAGNTASGVTILTTLLLAGSLAPRWIAFAQQPRASFEVTSVKPSGPDDQLMYRLQPSGRYLVTSVTLKMLVANAYGVPELQIAGAPAWGNSDKFNIEAKVGKPLPPWPDSNKELSLMLQSLLEDRFKVAVHRETRDEPVYELVVGKSGARLTPAKADESAGFGMEPGRVRSMAVPLLYLATNLGNTLGRTIIDKTGLEGKFSYTLSWTPDEAATPDANGVSLFTALQEQLGLQLKSTKAPVEVLIIDHAERPDAN